MRNIFVLTLMAIIAFMGLTVALIITAHAHKAPPSAAQPAGWQYDMSCCHNQDCAPVDKITYTPIGQMVVTTKFGSAAVPLDIKPPALRPSPDTLMHACIINENLRCLYMPPGM